MSGTEGQSKFAPVAIVGAGALFPGSSGPSDFWKNIQNGADLVSEVPPGHWLLDDYYDPDPAKPGKTYARRGAFLSPTDFDPLEYGIPPNNLPVTDTAQLLGLVVARWALQDAYGPNLEGLDRRRTSVILGVASATELVATMSGSLQRPIWEKALREAGLAENDIQTICDNAARSYVGWTENTFPGLLGNVVAGRIANRFDLGGTNCVIDAACASSLAAVRMGIQELALHTSDLVVTGGVDALNDILMFMCFSKTSAMSPTGDCRPFSIDADGTMLGEGLGLLALRRLEDAEREGNKIYAVIRGLGSSSDGRAKSIYAPRAEGQVLALRRTYDAAGYAPSTVGLVEAHGTGTTAGDLAEITALKSIFSDGSSPAAPWCALGSVKSQIGHTKGAAGAASLYKVAMALHHKVLPPTIKVSAPNPELGIDESPFYLNTKLRPWISGHNRPRRASVSSFGFGGSNFHVTLEEYRGPNSPDRIRNFPTELFLIDAPSAASMKARVEAVIDDVKGKGFQFAARATQLGFRSDAKFRLAAVGAGTDEIVALLRDCAARIEQQPDNDFAHPKGAFYANGFVEPARVAFLFPGQGSQYVNMGLDLAIGFEAARRVWDDASSETPDNFPDIAGYVYPPPGFTAQSLADQAEALTATQIAQPAIGLVSQMQLALLERLGLRADAVAGHSFGEVTALFCAGVLDASGFRAIAERRGSLMADAARDTQGAMLAVFAPKALLDKALLDLNRRDLVIANENAPEQFVIAGPRVAIELAVQFFTQRDISHRLLPVATAFHSPVVSRAREPFAGFLQSVPIAPPNLSVYANSTAGPYPAAPDLIRDQLAAQLASPVYFSRQIGALYAAGTRLFIEVGPGSVLSELTSACLAGRPHRAVALDRKGRNGVTQLFTALGQIAVAGIKLDFAALWDGFAVEETSETVLSSCSVKLTGANFGKPNPSTAVAAAPAVAPIFKPATPPLQSAPKSTIPSAPMSLPQPTVRANPNTPAPPTPAFPSATAPRRDTAPVAMPDGSQWHDMVLALHQQSARAHEASQKAMLDAHLAFLQTSQTALRGLQELLTGQDVRSLVAAETLLPSPIAPTLPQPVQPDLKTAIADPDRQARSIVEPARMPAPSVRPKPVTPIAAVSPIRASDRDLGALLLKIVAEKTGYPVDMLKPDMELETDLGIDSIKRVEILAALREAAPDLPEVDTRELAGLRTLSAILARLGDGRVTAPLATPAPAAAADRDLGALLLTIVAEKTGYPVDMLKPDMELETDLGIDSIKRVEILAALREAAPDLPEVDTRELAGLRTLSAILARLGTGGVTAPAIAALPAVVPDRDSDRDLGALLLQIVAEKTGYPVDMLNPEMELETDLGIDSIKRVEILAALREAAPELPEVDTRELAGLRTLSSILARLGGEKDPPAAMAKPNIVRRSAEAEAEPLSRVGLACAETPRSGKGMAEIAAGKTIDVVGGSGELATALVAALAKRGITARLTSGANGSDAAILLAGLDGQSPVDSLTAHLEVFRSARSFAGSGGKSRTFVTLQDTGGDFGLSGRHGDRAWLGGFSGLIKTAAKEWPSITLKSMDVERADRHPAGIAEAIVDELTAGGPELEVGLTADGRRLTLVETVLDAVPNGVAWSSQRQPVIVVSGGARGILPACLLALTKFCRPRLALIGRTKLDEETSATRDVDDAALLGVLHQTLTASGQSLTPLQLSARAQDILYGRKIRRTIAQLQHVGAEPLYLTADVADTSQLADALALVRSKWGRIDGIIHGAGVLADRLIVDKTDEQFAKVFRTKVDGLRSFLEATEQDDLKFITLFSSVAARYGNVGQCDYAAANEVMNKVARAEALRRGNGCRIKSLNWAPWDSGMMTDALRRQFLERGISLIPEQIGAQAFVAELMSNGPDVDLVIRHANGGAGLGAADETAIYSTKRTN